MRANTWRILVVCEDDVQRLAFIQAAEGCGLLVGQAASAQQAAVFLQISGMAGSYQLILAVEMDGDPDFPVLFETLSSSSPSIAIPVLLVHPSQGRPSRWIQTRYPGKVLAVQAVPEVTSLRRAITALLGDLSSQNRFLLPKNPPAFLDKPPEILVAEDDADCRRLIALQMDSLGVKAEIVENGRKVIEAVIDQGKPYELLLMNGHMPDLDGYTATRIIRQAELFNGQHLPILAITANPFNSERKAYLSAGMDDVLCKPILLDDLRRALQQWRRRQGSDDQPPPTEDLSPIEPVIDSVLMDIQDLQLAGEPDLVDQLVDIYLNEATGLLEKLKLTVQHDEPSAVRQLARKLNTSSANLGVQYLANLCQEIENQALLGDLNAVVRLLHRAEDEYARVWQVFKARKHPILEKKPQLP